MGSGGSTINHNHRAGSDSDRRNPSREHQRRTIDRERNSENETPIIRHDEEQTLPYLQNTNAQRKNSSVTTEHPEVSKLNRERFHKILGLVRKESKTLNSFNAKAFGMRKRELATMVSLSVQQERKEAEERLQRELTEQATGHALAEDLDDGRNMLFSMIGYELSSDEEDLEEEEEEHDIHRPRTTDSMLSECVIVKKDSTSLSVSSSNVSSPNVSRCNSKTTDEGPDEMPRNRFDYNVFEEHDNDQPTHRISSGSQSSRSGNNSRDFDEEENGLHFLDFEEEMAQEPDFEHEEEENICNNDGSDEENDASDISDDEVNLKDNDSRPSVSTTGLDDQLTYTPRRSSLLHNQILAKKKTKEHKLHAIMRQESLQERQARARLQLEKRRKLAEAQRQNYIIATEDIGWQSIVDEGTFDAKKNVKKEYKAYDRLRKESVAARQAKQRDTLTRRLEQRRQELGLGEGKSGQ